MKRKPNVPHAVRVVPKQPSISDRGYEVLTQATPRGFCSQKKSPEVVEGGSGNCLFFNFLFCIVVFCNLEVGNVFLWLFENLLF